MNAFEKLKQRILSQSGKDYYHALGYYLTHSKSAKYFTSDNGKPSHHPWLTNMRQLLRKLGWDKLIAFLNWCVNNHKHPWKGHLTAFLNRQAPAAPQASAKAAPVCACCHRAKTLIHTMCRECSSLTEEQRHRRQEQARLYKAGASLTAFGKWNKLTKKVLTGFIGLARRALEPIGQLQGQYKTYDVYDKKELRLLLSDVMES